MARASTRVSKRIRTPRTAVYQACLDPTALASWRVPDNMTGHVHVFEGREGGEFRMSLTDNDAQRSPDGKTAEGTDTFEGRFLELVPGERIVKVIEFESQDPRFAGEMRMTTNFADIDGGTEITIICEGLPAGIRPEDNEAGTEQALEKLAALVAV